MKEGLLTDEKLKSSYLALKKVSDQVKKDYNRLIKEDFQEDEWRREGRKIDVNLKKYEKMLGEVERLLENAKDNESASEESISTVEEGLEKLKDTLDPMVRAMNDKINQFDTNFEMDNQNNEGENEEEQEQEQGQITMNLMNNQEMLKQRREELQEIKDTTDKMAQDLVKQGEQLDDVEAHVVKAEDNVDKANKEINKANELSKGNTKRLCCILFIVVVAIGVILAIVLSLVLK